MDVVLLSGGKGTRLKEVVFDRPKPTAEINDLPFMNMLLEIMRFNSDLNVVFYAFVTKQIILKSSIRMATNH